MRLVTRLVFLVLLSAYNQDPCTDFHDQYVKWRRFAQGCAFWGSRKQNFTFWPHFSQKTQIFGQFSTGHKISRQKGLNNGDAGVLPLIVIVDHESCIVNRHIGAEDSKYGVTADPLLTDREDLLFEFWDPLHILGTVWARNFTFGMQIDHRGH